MSALKTLIEATNGEKPRVLGLKAVSGVRPRLDIDVLMRDDPDVFNLFILAFAELKTSPDKMGYFEIAGIHGLPKRAWDGVENKMNIGNTGIKDGSGYCTHSIELFPPWHRAYLAMLEQAIFLKMLHVADLWTLPEHKKKYIDAAYRFRLPYWDYFRPRGGSVTFDGVFGGDDDKKRTTYSYDFRAPTVFTSGRIKARTWPDDKLEILSTANKRFGKNPFFDFTFPTGEGKIDTDDWKQIGTKEEFPRTHTVRYPKYKGTSSTGALDRVLNSMRMDSNRLALAMITEDIYSNYDTFACDNETVDVKLPNETKEAKRTYAASGSLEDLHNKYHLMIGGGAGLAGGAGGHLSRVPCAAFDPAFWFHHGNIERLFSIWQAANAKKGDKNWYKNRPELAQQPLLPFRVDDEKFWDSDGVKTTEVLGYNYPETAGSPEEVIKRVNDMYYWSVPDSDIGQNGDIPNSMVPIKVEELIFFKGLDGLHAESSFDEEMPTAPLPPITLPVNAPTQEYARDWYVDDKVQRLALNGAFTIYYFVGSDGSGPAPGSNLMLQGTLVGLNHVFTAPVELCDNCGVQAERSEVVSSTSAITSQLLDYVKLGALGSLEPDDVLPFLKKNLKWRIVTVNGEIIDPRALAASKGLTVGVSAKKVRLPRILDDVEYEVYPEVVEAILAQASPVMDTVV